MFNVNVNYYISQEHICFSDIELNIYKMSFLRISWI